MSIPRSGKSETVPALLAKLGGRGKGGGLTFKKPVAYDTGKPGAEFVWTNMETMDHASWNRQAEAFQVLAPGLKRWVDHWSLSLDPRLGKLSCADWEEGARAFLEDLGYGGCLATVYQHHDEPQDHVHITVLRLHFGKDGNVETVSDSHIFKRSHAAAERAARRLGLKPMPRRDDAVEAPASSDSQVAATERARRRGTPIVKPAALAMTFDSVIARSTTLDELVQKAADAGIEVHVIHKSKSRTVQGLNVRPVGVVEWTKLSELRRDRSLSWSKVEPRLAHNANLRARAQAEADRINTAARESATTRVAARLAKHSEQVPVSQQARALTPGAAQKAKEAVTIMNDDKLEFPHAPSPQRPEDVPLDDSGLSLTVAASDEALERHKMTKKKEQEEHDRDQAMLNVQSEIRKLSVRELLDLRSKVPPFVLSAAAIERLVNLIIRLLSLGIVKRVNVLSDALAAREELREYAERELDRRRRTPAGLADRKAVLEEYTAAVQERSTRLSKRLSDRNIIALHRDRAAEATALRERIEAGFDQRRVAHGLDTIAERRAVHKSAVLAHRAVRDEKLVPVGFAGVLVTKAQRDAAAAQKADAALKVKQAAEARAKARANLYLLIDEVEEAAAKREQLVAENETAVAKLEAFERDAIARELRLLPDQVREVALLAQRVQREVRAATLAADAARPRALDEIESEAAEAEAESIRLRTMIDRG